MTGIESKKIPQSATRVSLEDPDEIAYWCSFFRVNEARLRIAVRAVGYLVKNIEAFIKKPQIEI